MSEAVKAGPEMSRMVKAKALPAEPVRVFADKQERADLAQRFALVSVIELTASLSLSAQGSAIVATGPMRARWVQPCAVSGEDIAVNHSETLSLRFVPASNQPPTPDSEVELDAEECDEIDYDGDMFDLGEAVAQSLGLAIDPFATGPEADRVRREKGIQVEGEQAGPMAEMLAALKRD